MERCVPAVEAAGCWERREQPHAHDGRIGGPHLEAALSAIVAHVTVDADRVEVRRAVRHDLRNVERREPAA